MLLSAIVISKKVTHIISTSTPPTSQFFKWIAGNNSHDLSPFRPKDPRSMTFKNNLKCEMPILPRYISSQLELRDQNSLTYFSVANKIWFDLLSCIVMSKGMSSAKWQWCQESRALTALINSPSYDWERMSVKLTTAIWLKERLILLDMATLAGLMSL